MLFSPAQHRCTRLRGFIGSLSLPVGMVARMGTIRGYPGDYLCVTRDELRAFSASRWERRETGRFSNILCFSVVETQQVV
jgi:hypothetical protein